MTLIVLVATKGVSQFQRKMCEKARRYLDEQKVPYEVVEAKVDEINQEDPETGLPIKYPQFFLQYGNGEITHLGNIDNIKHLMPVLSSMKVEEKTPKSPGKSPQRQEKSSKGAVAIKPDDVPLEPLVADVEEKAPKSPGKSPQRQEKSSKRAVAIKSDDVPLEPLLVDSGVATKDVESEPTAAAKKRSKPRKLFQVPDNSDAPTPKKVSKDSDSKPAKTSAPASPKRKETTKKEPVQVKSPEKMEKVKKSPSSPLTNTGKVRSPKASDKSARPSIAKGFIPPPMDVVQVVNTDESYQRPDRTRGGLYDDDHSSISDALSWADRDSKGVPCVRPMSVRGFSFEDEESELALKSQNKPEPEAAVTTKAKRPAFNRSKSFDESDHSRVVALQSPGKSNSRIQPSVGPSMIQGVTNVDCNQSPGIGGHATDPYRIDLMNTKSFDAKFTISPAPSWLFSNEKTEGDDGLSKLTSKLPKAPVYKTEPAPMEHVDEDDQGEADAHDKKQLEFDGKTTFTIAAGPSWLYG